MSKAHHLSQEIVGCLEVLLSLHSVEVGLAIGPSKEPVAKFGLAANAIRQGTPIRVKRIPWIAEERVSSSMFCEDVVKGTNIDQGQVFNA